MFSHNNDLEPVLESPDAIKNVTINVTDIFNELHTLNPKMFIGPDGISNIYLKEFTCAYIYYRQSFIDYFLFHYNKIFSLQYGNHIL